MQILIVAGIALLAILFVLSYRRKQDGQMVAERVRERGGELISMNRVKRGGPFPDTGRGWWAWQVEWRAPEGPRTAWVLTTREGIKEWRD